MIYLNLLNKIFGPKKPLTRKEIDQLKVGEASHVTESKGNDDGLNQEAMEGWSTIDSDVDTTMESLDKKMSNKFSSQSSPKSQKNIYFFLGIFSVAMMMLILYTYQGNTLTTDKSAGQPFEQPKASTSSKKNTVSKEHREVKNTIAAVDQYTEINKDQQITKEQLKTPTEKLENIEDSKVEKSESKRSTNVESLSPKNLTAIPTKETGSLSYKMVAEIYLNKLKSVDYRNLRENQPIELLQELPMGTPANKENAQNQRELQSETITKKISYMEYLENTQQYFVNGNYKRALKRYIVILEQYPEDVNAHFYSGLCYHNLGQYQKAVNHFEKSYSLGLGNFREEAQWFKAKSLIQLNEKSQAKSLLQAIQYEGGFYSEQAAKLLNSL